MQERFGQLIRRLRGERGYTLTQLGAKLNIDSGALSKIENGKKKLDEKILPKLASIFQLDLPKLQDEYFSEIIANEVFHRKCSERVLALAEQKIKYMRDQNTKQAQLSLG